MRTWVAVGCGEGVPPSGAADGALSALESPRSRSARLDCDLRAKRAEAGSAAHAGSRIIAFGASPPSGSSERGCPPMDVQTVVALCAVFSVVLGMIGLSRRK